MNNIYSTNFERLRETYLDIFEPLERAFKNWDIDFYLIGAQSRDIWTDHLNLKKRTTSDIDFCVFIKEWDTWNEFIQYLIHKEGFEKDKMEPYRFHKVLTIKTPTTPLTYVTAARKSPRSTVQASGDHLNAAVQAYFCSQSAQVHASVNILKSWTNDSCQQALLLKTGAV
jgi:hypothetical protein